MLVKTPFRFLLLMQRGAQILDFCNTSAVKVPRIFRSNYARGVVKVKRLLPMLRKNHFFLGFSWSAGIVFSQLT